MADKSFACAALEPVRSTTEKSDSTHHTLQPATTMSGLIDAYDWSANSLGPKDQWPQQLHVTVGLMLDSAFPTFIWWGRDDLTCLYNDAYSRVIGGAHPGALGASACTAWPDVWPQVGPQAMQVFSDGQPIYRQDVPLMLHRSADRTGSNSKDSQSVEDSADPEEAYFSLSYSPIRDKSGVIAGLLCTVVETTEDVRERQRLMLINQAKDEFISLASHQLRTPATGVKQYLGMLLGDFAGKLTTVQREFVQHAYESNERQLSTVSDLLSIAQADAGKISLHCRPVDIVQMINNILEEQSTKFGDRNQIVKFKHQQPSYSVVIDEERMRMVLENLVDNASKYTEPGKSIRLMLEQPIDAKHGAPGTTDEIIIVVKDRGVGIEKKDLSTIFDKFIRVDNPLSEKVGGSGLGLYLAKKIVELHGGTITASSTLGKGSAFSVHLPITPPKY